MTAQERFNETYITSTEIMQDFGITRSAIVYARKRGALPDEIMVNDGHIILWERATIAPYLEAWKKNRAHV